MEAGQIAGADNEDQWMKRLRRKADKRRTASNCCVVGHESSILPQAFALHFKPVGYLSEVLNLLKVVDSQEVQGRMGCCKNPIWDAIRLHACNTRLSMDEATIA